LSAGYSAGKEVIFMESGLYLSADEIAVLLGVSKGHAYKVIRDCNDELKDDGYITIAGRVPKSISVENVMATKIL
jgi:hypothetical protein